MKGVVCLWLWASVVLQNAVAGKLNQPALISLQCIIVYQCGLNVFYWTKCYCWSTQSTCHCSETSHTLLTGKSSNNFQGNSVYSTHYSLSCVIVSQLTSHASFSCSVMLLYNTGMIGPMFASSSFRFPLLFWQEIKFIEISFTFKFDVNSYVTVFSHLHYNTYRPQATCILLSVNYLVRIAR